MAPDPAKKEEKGHALTPYTLPELYLSRPAVYLPGERLHNDDVLAEVQRRYRGDPRGWPLIEAGVRAVFARCNSEYRHIERDPSVRVGDVAARAAAACLDQCDVAAGELDLVIHAGIAREYFEPATAMEVAARVGCEAVHAFDVTSACVGQLEALVVAAGLLALHPGHKHALVAAGELTRQFLSYEVQRPEELEQRVVGLTIGNAAAAWLLSRRPQPGGCARLLAAESYALPRHWDLCQAPIDGPFTSRSRELNELTVHVAPVVRRVIEAAGWSVDQVDHFVAHQPSEQMNRQVLSDLGADPERTLGTHHLYGNTASTTVALNMHELLRQRGVEAGDRLIFSSAAAGFSVVTLAGVWQV